MTAGALFLTASADVQRDRIEVSIWAWGRGFRRRIEAYLHAVMVWQVYVTRTGEVGSIGIVAAHVDQSGADAKAGLA